MFWKSKVTGKGFPLHVDWKSYHVSHLSVDDALHHLLRHAHLFPLRMKKAISGTGTETSIRPNEACAFHEWLVMNEYR